ncbi:E3 ubiquitin-protein ligase SH3RF2 [Motacilla alba alba]|uniref:E3 ubiquitin-protein ligase SH3RF2 n=1 Tax=Motacilla alba alba TaxID=1094192 RepID=UPI0018D5511C|nr:E3 ubiquitin-protein ligase SH3RF2 [Motacilla alba alba]XP_038006248.1 E3 ubiquitin-protein ligase SH3RF2 [Motacilla alba alba]
MDDLALLDLLECPVCFEKLDATAKVLPCQHTFCKPCLQRILKSQKELRCPECRTLVLGSIEQLPSNLLLIRLLDGVRCGQNVSRFGSVQRPGVLSSPASLRRVPRALQLHQHRLATNPRLHMEGVPRARALYTYRGHSPGELRFNKGDTIALLRQLDENWYLGELNGASGVFPASSVQVIKQLPLPRPLYSLDLRSRDKAEGKDILTFPKPSGPGQQLLAAAKGRWSPPPKGASLRAAKAKAEPAALPKVPEPRRKSLRQFSITTALNTLNRMVHAPAERPALHISSPVLISSSNPSVPTQGSERAELPCGTPLQVSASYCPAAGALGPPAAIVTLPQLQQHGPAYLCVALHSYAAHGPDELELQKGEGVRVFGKDQDGWLRGMSLVTGRVGLFPSNYVAPLFRKSSLSESKMPSLYTSWTLSTSSLSSQGSVPEGGPRQSRALRPLLLPVPVPCPARAPAPLRRGRGSARRNGSLQRPGQAGTPVQITGSLRRPAAAGRPQHFQLYPHVSSAPHSIPAGATDETTRPNSSYEAAPALLLRGGESRSPSVCSSVILDAKEPSVKSEAAPKPPASAPPSILVKPETSRNSAEKQVKTVRFQNHSPPPPKRHSLQPSPRLPRSRTEPGPEGLLGPELLLLCSPRLGSSPLHPRRALHPKALSLDLSGQLTFPIKKSYSSISAN